MPSSTSSSERAPAGRWAATWALALVLAAAAIAGAELGARRLGYQPSVVDDDALWALERARVGAGPRTLVLLGSSRLQLAIDTEVLRARLPGWSVHQLAMHGREPTALLDLAADPGFHGVAVYEQTEWQLGPDTLWAQLGGVRTYRHRWRAAVRLANRWLGATIEAHSALRAAGGRRALAGLLDHGALPAAPYLVTAPDRSRAADYARASLAPLQAVARADLERARPAPARWLADARFIAPAIHAIERRGGRVVLLRLPISAGRAADGSLRYPLDAYWRPLVAALGVAAIHADDEPRLAGFPTPDGTHLDGRDRARLSGVLVDLLGARGVLAR